MSIPAAALNRRVTFLRRAAIPAAAADRRGGFVSLGMPQWAALRPRGSTNLNVGRVTFTVPVASVTLRTSRFTESISTSDRVETDQGVFEITSKEYPDRPDGTVRFNLREAPSGALYAREFETRGEVVTVRRIVPNAPAVDCEARAVVTGYKPEELGGGIDAGHRWLLICADDLTLGGFPQPIRKNDRILIDGDGIALTVLAADAQTHRNAGTLYAYEVQAAG